MPRSDSGYVTVKLTKNQWGFVLWALRRETTKEADRIRTKILAQLSYLGALEHTR